MINNVVLLGRIVADPELKQTPNGNSVANFTLAVDRSYCKPGTERQCDFLDCVAWKGTGEFISKYFRKGQLIAVTGSIQTRSYTDKGGSKRKVFEILVNSASFCESKKSSGIADTNPYLAGDKPAPKAKAENSGDFEEVPADDDLPF